MGVRDTHRVSLRTKDKDRILLGTVGRDGFLSRSDRPLDGPSMVDPWPKTVQGLLVLMMEKVRPLGQQPFELISGLPLGPRLGDICLG